MTPRSTPLATVKKILWKGFPALLLVALSTHLLSPLSAKTNRPGIIYWHGDPAEKKIALTFDDGPNEPYTSEILQILRQNKVHATFFLMGENVEAYPDAARAIVQDGHAIGNHSYTHHDLMWQSNRQVRNEITRTEAIIERTTGEHSRLFRPPYGAEDMLTLHQTSKLGYIMVEWTVSARDWRRPGARRIVENVMHHVGNGAIILMHDGDKWRHGSDRSQTVAALPVLIQQLRDQGYEFVTVPELLKLHDYN